MWEQIKSNQVRSAVLVISMAALMLLLGYSIGVVVDSPVVGVVIALLVWGMMTLVAVFQGDSILLAVSGARKIAPEDHPRLYNIVEEMKIASGLEKMPDIYIIDDPALNAFATGRDPNHTAVAITSGLLQKLNRDELQGVIGHEIAHVKNRDVRLMSLLAVLLGSIVILSYYASRFMFYGGMPRSRRSSSKDGGGGVAQLIVLAVGIVLIILAPIFAQLMYFAVSRKREYLADASSALYTRYPGGLASALEKLAASDVQVRAANKATAPMYIINPFKKGGMSVSELTATHPPISERVRILRSMGGASAADYESAYKQVKGRGGIMPASALSGAGAMALRAPSAAGALADSPGGEIERARETSDVMWRLNAYETVDCECGAKLKIPPSLKGGRVRCPHCGRVHHV